MCTKAEVGEQIQESVPKIIENVLAKKTAKFVWGYWVLMGTVIVTATSAWFTLYNQVQNNTDKLSEGGRYTQQEHELYAQQVNIQLDTLSKEIETLRSDYKEDISEMKKDIRFIREKLGG